MKGQPRISSIYDRANGAPPTGEQARAQTEDAKKRAWHRFGLVVIDPEDINDEWTRQTFINEANKRYGRRGKNGL